MRSAAAPATRPRASTRCARPSTGATQLLTDRERQCFARFAVFAGGATVEAAEAVTHARLDTLDDLAAKSLLIRGQHARTPTRLGMLETIRAYAGERFGSAADAGTVREDHYRYYLGLAQRHATDRALRGADAREHLARLDAEFDNLQAALEWAVAQPRAEPAVAMAVALGGYWVARDRYTDAVDWIEQALNLPGADADPALHVCLCASRARRCGGWGEEPSSPRSWPPRRRSPAHSAIP